MKVVRPDMQTLGRVFLFTFCLYSSPIVAAEGDNGWYASLGIGATYAEKLKINEIDGIVDYDVSIPVFSGAFGRSFLDNWRMEFGVSHQVTEPEILYFPDNGIEIDPAPNDRINATSYMFNVLRDFRVGIGLRPYFGFGVGPSRVHFELGEAGTPQIPRRGILDDRSWALAYQAIAGITVPLTTRLDLGLDYRYWRAPSIKVTDATGRNIDADQTIHSGWMELRYRFGTNADPDWKSAQKRPSPEPRGVYLAGSLGIGRPIDAEISNSIANFDAFSPGPIASVSLGYTLGERWRVEIEASRRDNASQILDFGTAGSERRTKGEVRADSMMVNAIFRFRPGSSIRPLAGVGVGVVRAKYDVRFADDGVVFIDDEATGGVVQWMVGFDIAMTSRLTFTTDFRMWITEKLKLQQPDGTDIKSFHVVHSTVIGLRYTFE